MKKLVLSILLCFSVGLTLMGSPAQVSGDNHAGGVRGRKVLSVSGRPRSSASKVHVLSKQELKRNGVNAQQLRANGQHMNTGVSNIISNKIDKGKVVWAGEIKPIIIIDPDTPIFRPHSDPGIVNPRLSNYVNPINKGKQR